MIFYPLFLQVEGKILNRFYIKFERETKIEVKTNIISLINTTT